MSYFRRHISDVILQTSYFRRHTSDVIPQIRVIAKLPNSEQSYKGKVKAHNYINRQNQSTIENCENRNDPKLGTGISKEMVG